MKVILDAFLMGRITWDKLPEAHKVNANEIIQRVNSLLVYYTYSYPIFITKLNDGYRLVPAKGGSKTSKHLTAQAIDMDDNEAGDFWNWLKDNLYLLKSIGLWIEHPCWTHNEGGTWIHFQSVPPKSGRRIYVPNELPNPNPAFWDGHYDSSLD